MTELYFPNFDEPDPTPQEQLETHLKHRWDLMDDLRVVDMLIATLRNQIKGEVHE